MDLDSLPNVSPDIESEDTSGGAMLKPFDPNQIRVKLWTPTVDLVLRRLRNNEIDLAADFQRAAGIWKDRAQSQLIESLLIRIPLPAFYVDGANEDLLVVVDGIQRLTAIRRFVLDKDLKLREMEYLTDLNGRGFGDLPRPLQRRIEETMLTVYLIDKGTPEAAKLNIFKRLNTGGEPLTSQEIRHAMNPGPARTFLKELADSPEFRAATQDKFRDDRMTDRECALRFCAFLSVSPGSYPAGGNLDAFLHDAMRTINVMPPKKRTDLARRLSRSMSAAQRILEDDAFRKPSTSGRRAPVNKALFEVWAVNFDRRDDEQIEILVRRKRRLQSGFEKAFADSRDFERALSQGTGDPAKVRMRFSVVDQLLTETISS